MAKSAFDRYGNWSEGVPTDNTITLFTGSSSFYYWYTLEEDFSDYCAVNRAVPGATAASINKELDNILLLKPAAIVLIVGENDVADKRFTPEQVIENVDQFVTTIHAELPDTYIILMGTKMSGYSRPGPWWKARWCIREVLYEYLELMKAYAEDEARSSFVSFVDGMDVLLGMPCYPDAPNTTLLFTDCMHPNPLGLSKWFPLIKAELDRTVGARQNCTYTPQKGLEAKPAWVPNPDKVCGDSWPYRCTEEDPGDAEDRPLPSCDGNQTLCSERQCECGCISTMRPLWGGDPPPPPAVSPGEGLSFPPPDVVSPPTLSLSPSDTKSPPTASEQGKRHSQDGWKSYEIWGLVGSVFLGIAFGFIIFTVITRFYVKPSKAKDKGKMLVE